MSKRARRERRRRQPRPLVHPPEVEASLAEFLSPEQVAELLGVSRVTVYRWRRQGELPEPIRIGGSIRWHRPTLRDILTKKGKA
jgi:excisionase family DNA binding protein